MHDLRTRKISLACGVSRDARLLRRHGNCQCKPITGQNVLKVAVDLGHEWCIFCRQHPRFLVAAYPKISYVIQLTVTLVSLHEFE